MTWPAADVGTTNADAGTDSPATARTDLLDLMTKFNQVRNHVSAFIQTLLDDAAASNARTTLGAAASGANADITSVATTTTINGTVIGYREIPQNSQSVAYTLVAGDAGSTCSIRVPTPRPGSGRFPPMRRLRFRSGRRSPSSTRFRPG